MEFLDKNNLLLKTLLKKKVSGSGFTIVELLVTISIFFVIIVAFVNTFAFSLREQSKNLEMTNILNNASFASEYISKALRMAQKDKTGVCVGTAKHNYSEDAGGNPTSVIKFLNGEGKCQEFLLDGNEIKVKFVGIDADSTPLTASSIIVEDLKFKVQGDGQGDGLQPKVTFVFKMRTENMKTPFIFQTTVSQRALDVSI